MNQSIRIAAFVLASAFVLSAEKVSVDQLLKLADSKSAGLEAALRDTLTAANLEKGIAVLGEHGEFVWAIQSAVRPQLQVIGQPPAAPFQIGELWVYRGKLNTGTAYKWHWLLDGKSFGGDSNLAAFGPDSYAQPDAPEGKQVGPLQIESKVYPGVKANVWYYVPAQWDGSTPLPVQIWGDGQFYVAARPDNYRVREALDNLTAQKKIPLMVNVFVQPGTGGARNQRSIEYDTVSDTYARYILEDILPEVAKTVKLRTDSYSRAMVGESSGGICAFTAAYLKPDQFSRVLSWIGSFTALQTSELHPAGGGEYPFMVRREPKRNIRVWLQDGAEDQENPRAGSWPLSNIHLANSLKLKGYDYHFSFGPGTHSQRQGSAELPASLIWLWRGYDPAKTAEEFIQDPAEKEKPVWRVVSLNRD